MKIAQDGLTHYYQYESLTEVASQINPYEVGRLYREYGPNWVGETIPTKSSLDDKMSKVWIKGIDAISRFAKKLQDVPQPDVKSHVRRTRYHEDDGDEICLDRLRNGQPFWRKSERELTTGSTEVSIMFNSGANANVSSDDFMWRGAVAIALTQILESRGYRTEIWAVDATRCNDGSDTMIIEGLRLKRSTDLLDISSLSMGVSGWFYRLGLISSQVGIAKSIGKSLGRGEGRAMEPTAKHFDTYSQDQNRICVSGVFSFQAALALVQYELEKLSEQTV